MNIANVAGPLLLGYLVNCGFQGILCVQICTYYVAFPNDKLIFKILVYLVFVLETVQTIIEVKDVYDTFVTAPRTVISLDRVRTLWFSIPIVGGLVAFIGQIFFAYRLRVLSKSWVPSVLVTFFALSGVVTAIVTGAKVRTMGMLSEVYISQNYITSGILYASSAVCDIVISAYMFYYLSCQIRHISHPNMRAKISRLIRLIVETGLLTATAALLNLIFIFSFKGSSYFAVPSAIVSKLYANTMLLILNNRVTIIGGRNDLEDEFQPEGELQGESHDHRKWRHVKPSTGSGSSTTVSTEDWSDSIGESHFTVTHTSG